MRTPSYCRLLLLWLVKTHTAVSEVFASINENKSRITLYVLDDDWLHYVFKNNTW